MRIIKLNSYILQCLEPSCKVIPTIETKLTLAGQKVVQVLTCSAHEERGKVGLRKFIERESRLKMEMEVYPQWLEQILISASETGFLHGKKMTENELDRLRNFLDPEQRREYRRRPGGER